MTIDSKFACIPETEDFLAAISDSEYNRNIRPKWTASGSTIKNAHKDR